MLEFQIVDCDAEHFDRRDTQEDFPLRQTIMMQPDYAGRFRCVGPDCEDTCCAGWTVSVDEAACQKYVSLRDSPLQSLFETCIQRHPSPSEGTTGAFATVRMLPSGVCPFLSEERLCRIQSEHGESYLCHTCTVYPRTIHSIDGLQETKLSLSCPEAARLVLLSPTLFPPAGSSGYVFHWEDMSATSHALRPFFWPIRAFVLSLILNRNYPLWQRLFLLGTFSRRLDAFSRGEIDRRFAEVMDDFSRAVAAGGLCTAMETIPADLHLQLEIVLSLIASRVNGTPIGPRLRQVLDLFIEGVGSADPAWIEGRTSRYARAYQLYYNPFFRRHPGILENYLVNAVLRDTFPLGKRLFQDGAEPEPARAFALLAIQFALIKGLLIGVAGARGARFDVADAIMTVQTAFKHFEHNHQFLPDAYAMLSNRGLADARGLTMLLRN